MHIVYMVLVDDTVGGDSVLNLHNLSTSGDNVFTVGLALRGLTC